METLIVVTHIGKDGKRYRIGVNASDIHMVADNGRGDTHLIMKGGEVFAADSSFDAVIMALAEAYVNVVETSDLQERMEKPNEAVRVIMPSSDIITPH